MRIREIRLVRYGKFTDRTLALPAGERDIHLVVGPNEAGKSTCRHAIGDWLFGIPARTPLAFLHPMPELRVGGVLERRVAGAAAARLSFDRVKGNKNTLRTADDAPLHESALQPWLGSLQASAFKRMYALDHTTLVEGGAGILSASDDIGRLLFQSAAGIEHLGAALQKLQADADALWAPRKSGTRAYYQALEAYETAGAAFKQATLRTRDWQAQHDALLATEAALAAARGRDTEVRRELSRLERMRRVRPMLLDWDACRAQRDALLSAGDIPLLADHAAEVLGAARQALLLAAADRDRLQHDIDRCRLELAATPVEPTVLALAADITALNERRLQFRAHRSDIVKRSEEIRVEWLRVQELAADLGWPAQSEDAVRQRLPATPLRLRLLRLLKDRVLVAQELRAAQGRLAERQQQVEQSAQALARLSAGAGAVDAGLAAAVEQASRFGDHAAVMADGQRKADSLAQKIDTGLAALGAWRQAPDALQAMVVPAAALVQGLIDEQRSDAAAAQTQQAALAAKTLDLQRMALELQQLVREFQPVSSEQVQQARRVRDAAWQAIKLAPQRLADAAAAFESRVVDADTLADARLDRAQHEAARQARADGIEQQRLEIGHLAAQLQALQSRIDARAGEWQALTAACGLPSLPLALAPAWLLQREAVLALVDEAADTERQRSARRQAAAEMRQALWSMLAAASGVSSGGSAFASDVASDVAADAASDLENDLGNDAAAAVPALAECVRRAQARIRLAEQERGQRETLERQLGDAQRSALTLQAAVDSARAASDAWCLSWQAALLAAGYDAAVPVDQVEAELEGIAEVERLLARIRGIRSERIETMQADLDGLAEMARRLAARAAPELEGQPADDLVLALAQRLDAARQAAAAAAALHSRLQRDEAELAAARQRALAAQASLAPLFSAAGVDGVDALAGAIERSDQRRDVEQRLQAAEAALTLAADGLAVEQLRAEIAGVGPDEARARFEQLARDATDVVEQIADLSRRHGTQKTAFDALAGTDRAAQADARRQEAMAAMADAAERYLQLHTASRLLKWSMEKFRETKQGPMLAKASAIFSGLTVASFSRLLVDAAGAAPRLFGIRASGEQVDVAGMSEGSRDQLYLALRLAALELQVEQGLDMPLIADDLFINFDDLRTAAGLRVLGELSRRMQVVFLTHHEHLVPLAQDVLGPGLNVVRL